MEHFVSPETAKKLLNVGFPQPEMVVGQAWYLFDYDLEMPYICCNPHMNHPTIDGSGGKHFDFFSPTSRQSLNWAKKPTDHLVFAPNATDILRELGGRHVLWYDDRPNIQMWFCRKLATFTEEGGKLIYHKNSAEAVAQAFLYQQEHISQNGRIN